MFYVFTALLALGMNAQLVLGIPGDSPIPFSHGSVQDLKPFYLFVCILLKNHPQDKPRPKNGLKWQNSCDIDCRLCVCAAAAL